MNHMKQVAEMLGVEFGEEFNIKGNGYSCNDYLYYYKYRLTERRLEFFSNGMWHTAPTTLVLLLNGQVKVVKIPKPILDKKEKEYLSYVIRPFRNRIKYFYKDCRGAKADHEAIVAVCTGYGSLEFPAFKKNTMYMGMEPNKK